MPLASSTSINKLQVMQNAALRTATGFPQDTNIQHLHDETLIHPIRDHLQFHTSQYQHNIQYPSHPLHNILQHCKAKHYASIVSRHLATTGNNKIFRTPPPHTSSSEETSPPHSSHPCPTQNKQISFLQIILTQRRRQITSITTIPHLQHPHTRHTSSLQLHPHTHHAVIPGFVDRPRWSDGAAGQMDR